MINYEKINKTKLQEKYQNSTFNHVVIDNFLNLEFAERLHDNFPSVDEHNWWEYNNVFEKKYAMNNLRILDPVFQEFFNVLFSLNFTNFLSSITGVERIISDPSLFGGGLHQIMPGGKLDIHSDFPRHRVTGWRRQINLIYYLNKGWKNQYEGALELWDDNMSVCLEKIMPTFNRAVIFYTGGEHNNHGHPQILNCPDGLTRKSLASYYYTHDDNLNEPTNKSTLYKKRPEEPHDSEKEKLRIKRAKGRL